MNQSWVNSRVHDRLFRGSLFEVKVHVALIALISSTLLLQEPRITLILGGILCFVSYAWLGFREARKAPLWLSPLSFYFFWYCIGMGVSPLYVGLTASSGDMIRFASEISMVSLDELAKGYVLFLLGSLALHLGMQIFRPHADTKKEPPLGSHVLGWLAAVWLVGILFQLSPSSFSFLGQGVKIFAVAVVGSACGFAVTQRQKLGLSRFAFFAILLVGTGGLFFGNLASGSKAYIMYSFLPVFWFFVIRPRLRVWIPVLAIMLGFFYLGLVAPVVQTARQSPQEEGQNAREHLIQTFERLNSEKAEALDYSFLAEQLDRFIDRQFDAVPVGFIVGEVERSGLLLGETMKYVGYAFIPRILWPDKPGVTRGLWFGATLGLSPSEAEATTSIGMTAVGELYWNFGILGVMLGMLVIGCAYGGLWRMAGADPRGKPIHMLLYVSLMVTMPDMPEAVTVAVSLAITFLSFKGVFIAQRVTNRRRRKLELSAA
jgi:hypothetical protein